MLTAIHLGVRAIRLFHITASLLDYISLIKPVFQVPAARLALVILFITGALPQLLDLDFVMWKLRGAFDSRSRHFTGSQKTFSRFERSATHTLLTNVIVLDAEICGQSERWRMLPLFFI